MRIVLELTTAGSCAYAGVTQKPTANAAVIAKTMRDRIGISERDKNAASNVKPLSGPFCKFLGSYQLLFPAFASSQRAISASNRVIIIRRVIHCPARITIRIPVRIDYIVPGARVRPLWDIAGISPIRQLIDAIANVSHPGRVRVAWPWCGVIQ